MQAAPDFSSVLATRVFPALRESASLYRGKLYAAGLGNPFPPATCRVVVRRRRICTPYRAGTAERRRRFGLRIARGIPMETVDISSHNTRVAA